MFEAKGHNVLVALCSISHDNVSIFNAYSMQLHEMFCRK